MKSAAGDVMIQKSEGSNKGGVFAAVRAVTLALAMAIGIAGCAGSGDLASIPANDSQGSVASDHYKVGSGDKVRVIVYNQPDLTGEYQVDGTGSIAFPLIGGVAVNGLTVNGMEKKIADALSPDYLKNPSVSVEIVQFRPFYIVGEVKNPGSYPYVDGMRVINGVALAGGFTYRAREDSFYIRRVGDGSQAKQAAGQESPVWPGDVIIVRERYF